MKAETETWYEAQVKNGGQWIKTNPAKSKLQKVEDAKQVNHEHMLVNYSNAHNEYRIVLKQLSTVELV